MDSSAPTGIHRGCGPLRPKPPDGAAGCGFELISLKNFRSYNISAHTRVVAGSMKPPNTNFVIGCAVRVASMPAVTGCAGAVPARTAASAVNRNQCLLCMPVSHLQLPALPQIRLEQPVRRLAITEMPLVCLPVELPGNAERDRTQSEPLTVPGSSGEFRYAGRATLAGANPVLLVVDATL